MRLIDESIDLDGFFSRAGKAGSRALILDYDGTLAPFTVKRDEAYPYPGVREALEALMRTGRCRVVVVSGRAAHDLLPLLGFEGGVEVWGSHGWERLGPGGYEPPSLPEGVIRGLVEMARWAQGMGLEERLERKPACAAFHVRGLNQAEALRLMAMASAVMEGLSTTYGLEVQPFDGGVELRAPGRDKGHAVDAVLSGMDGDVAAAYLGDDLTDEDAFKAIAGRGLGVLVRPEPRDTAASLWIKPPEELFWFIGRWTAACKGG